MIRTFITLILVIAAFLAGFWTRGIVDINKKKLEEEKAKIKNIIDSTKAKTIDNIEKIKKDSDEIENKKDEIGKIMNKKIKNK
ncbi:MAG TPA: hypothetical protein PLD27_11285 [bacterium]|nr:hypothetical protein [bacterium]HOL48700.1 hypothetical protein [bacterium]HPQ19815.1 hypothetical protein [bacterium]